MSDEYKELGQRTAAELLLTGQKNIPFRTFGKITVATKQDRDDFWLAFSETKRVLEKMTKKQKFSEIMNTYQNQQNPVYNRKLEKKLPEPKQLEVKTKEVERKLQEKQEQVQAKEEIREKILKVRQDELENNAEEKNKEKENLDEIKNKLESHNDKLADINQNTDEEKRIGAYLNELQRIEKTKEHLNQDKDSEISNMQEELNKELDGLTSKLEELTQDEQKENAPATPAGVMSDGYDHDFDFD